jgi:hypothetical protein
MKFGICASFRDILALNTITFDYLEENVQRFLVPEEPQAYFEALLAEARTLPIPIETANVLIPSDLPLVATSTRQVDTVRLEHYIKTMLQRAEQVGIRVIVFGSGGARACPPGYDQHDAVQQYVGRMSAKANGSFTIATHTGSVPDIGHRYCVRSQRTDGYGYTFTKGAGGVSYGKPPLCNLSIA